MEIQTECVCAFCANRLPFDLPKEIIEATLNGKLVVFAGAGVSTEAKNIFRETLYEDILGELTTPPQTKLDFPSLTSLFCKSRTNGRQKLLQKIKFRFDYCKQFDELYRQASKFHRELAKIYQIGTIITTNWDDYFETECNAVPIVTPNDFAFYDLSDRKVFKIHGSISNYGSIIATKEDYIKCYRDLNRGIIGSHLKTILATKTILFVGYSFGDDDFRRIYNYLKKELKDILPHVFIVTLDNENPYFKNEDNFTIINTDCIFFISSIKEHLEGIRALIPTKNIDFVYMIKSLLHEVHILTADLLLLQKQSNLIYCTMYQDGMIHALDYLKFHSRSGTTFNPSKMVSDIKYYSTTLRKEKLRSKRYSDVAYIDGYVEGLKTIFSSGENIKEFPFWYLYGVGPIADQEFFIKSIDKKQIFNKQADIYARKHFAQSFVVGSEIVFQHQPFL
jgi:hypothetical protein